MTRNKANISIFSTLSLTGLRSDTVGCWEGGFFRSSFRLVVIREGFLQDPEYEYIQLLIKRREGREREGGILLLAVTH